MRRVAVVLGFCGSLGACMAYQETVPAQTLIGQVAPQESIDRTAVAAARAALGVAPSVHEDRLDLLLAAELNNPAVRAAKAALQAAQAADAVARQAPAPTLSVLGEYAQHATEKSPWLFGFTLDIPLDYGQRRASRQDAADTALLLARCDLADALWSMRAELRRDLTVLLASERRIELLRVLGGLRAQRQAALERRADAGEIGRDELYRVSLEIAADARLLREAEAARELAHAAIAATLGIRENALQLTATQWQEFLQPDLDASADAQDLAAHPDLLRAIAAYEQSDSDYRLQLAKQYPGLSIGPGYTWERGLVKLPLSLGLALPPLDLNRGAIASALAAREAAGVALESSYARIGTARDQAQTVLRQARAGLRAIRSADLPATRTIAQRAGRQFAAGELDRTQWALAQIDDVSMQLADVDALQRLREAESALEDALHRPVEGPELEIVPR